jgi:GNAT superfamily N-acetyltransferase
VTLLAFREATLRDAPLVFALTLAAYEEYRGRLTPESGVFEETLADVEHAILHDGAVIAYLDDEAAGCGRYEIAADRSHLYFDRLAVPPAYRRRGVASAIVRWFEQRARDLELPEVRLGVRLALPGNIALYSGLGYEVDGYEDRPGYGRISAWMRHRLSP